MQYFWQNVLELLKICENVKIISLLERMKIEESDEDLHSVDEDLKILNVLGNNKALQIDEEFNILTKCVRTFKNLWKNVKNISLPESI